MKTVFRFGVIFSILLLIIRHLATVPYFNLYFDDSIYITLNFVAIGAVMLFAINHYLKNHNADNNYRYWKGLAICFCSIMLGVIIYNFINPILTIGRFNLLLNLPTVIANCVLMFPVTLILSLIIPATFSSKTKESVQSENDDILDADI